METPARTFAKAVTWQVVGFLAMTLIGYLVTGSVAEGGVVAAVGAASGFVSYFLHERVWARIGWGLAAARSTRPTTTPPAPRARP